MTIHSVTPDFEIGSSILFHKQLSEFLSPDSSRILYRCRTDFETDSILPGLVPIQCRDYPAAVNPDFRDPGIARGLARGGEVIPGFEQRVVMISVGHGLMIVGPESVEDFRLRHTDGKADVIPHGD